jgi:hypothetical protein
MIMDPAVPMEDPMVSTVAPMPLHIPVDEGEAISPESVATQPEAEPPASTIGDVTSFEDFFPRIELNAGEKAGLAEWFKKDLKSCLRTVRKMQYNWDLYRAVYLLEYTERYFPDIGIASDLTSGLLLDKTLEAMDRMKRAISKGRPLFSPDMKVTGSESDVEFYNRSQWALHTVLTENMKVLDVVGDEAMFDFVVDGSLILETDTVYERVPHRTLKTFLRAEDLAAVEDKVIDKSVLEDAYYDIATKGTARVLVESDVVVRDGLKVFYVDKVDHLIPEGVFKDDELRFRTRRMYLTSTDLQALADSKWYDGEAVKQLLEHRASKRSLYSLRDNKDSGTQAMEQLNTQESDYGDLAYPWKDDDPENLSSVDGQPYQETFSVYRITCKYGYKTPGDPQGRIAKTCVFDYCPEGDVFLRQITYPHTKDMRNWFHFKLRYAPKSYYGFGFGAMLTKDDVLQSNLLGLYLESAVIATFRPAVTRHPDAGGRVPFEYGYGPAKIGYLNDVNDFKTVEIPIPPMGLINVLVLFVENRASNRTSITALTQGRTESSDPRSPAQKTAMLLGQASIGIDTMIDD